MARMQYNVHTLENGLRVVLVPMPENKTATVIVMTGTGSRYEDTRENGLAHFLEHMFFKGTKKRPCAKALNKERGAIIQEIDMYEDMPMRTVSNVFDELIFEKDHPLGRTILGPKENILSFTRKDFAEYL